MSTAAPVDRSGSRLKQGPAGFSLGEVKVGGLEVELAAHQLIYLEGDDAEVFFHVEAGCACSFRCDGGGQRSIDAFHLPHEVFGLEAGVRRRRSAEALSPCRLVRCERRRLVGLVNREPSAAEALMTWLLAQQDETTLRLTRLAHAHGPGRLMSFLLDLRTRYGRRSSVDLEMSRSDIADYLGFSSETVSRIFTRLRSDGVVAIKGRRVTWRTQPNQ